jgi:hypothetical protein
MKASVGDRIVISSSKLDGPSRDGKIIECRNADGSPPYVVEWSDTGQTGFLFPGPDATVQHLSADGPVSREAEAPARHVKTWRVELNIFEAGDDTTAHAVLIAEVAGVEASGRAHRRSTGVSVPEIGDEVAVARALRRLSDRLLAVASNDMTAVEGHPVTLNA